MRKKGFTLIELLAIIVILAVILVIAVPKIGNVISDEKKESFFLSAKSILRNVEYLKLEDNSMSKTSLSNLELDNLSENDYDINNSYVYSINKVIYIDLVGINKYAGLRLCHISKNDKSYTIANACSNLFIELTFDLDGGTSSKNLSGDYFQGENIVLNKPTKGECNFTGWTVTAGNSTISGNTLTIGTTDTTVKATWGEYLELVVNLNNGNMVNNPAGAHTIGETVNLNTPTRSGFVFTGWTVTAGNSTISGNTLTIGTTDTTINANWHAASELVINLNGGNMVDNPAGMQLVGETVNLNTPTRNGYVFDGWTKDYGNGVLSTNSITMSTEKTSIQANWKVFSHQVTFDANGGSLSGQTSTKTVIYKDTYGILPIPTKGNYVFIGWYTTVTNGTMISSSSVVNDDQNETLYAHWIKKEELYTTPGEYQFPVLEDGYYKLEVWAGEGYKGGTGGYSVGTYYAEKGSILYVSVGGAGSATIGGYNGGGDGWATSAKNCSCDWTDCYAWSSSGAGAGGGASHVATVSGLLKNLSSQTDKVLIVAGGGGGNTYNSPCSGQGGNWAGQAGGGKEGVGDYSGKQDSVHSSCPFGQGDTAGGGGWYGGGERSGGSGYIGNPLLINYDGVTKIMYCDGCTVSTSDNDRTSIASASSESPESNKTKTGDGAVKITYVSNIKPPAVTTKTFNYSNNYGLFDIEKPGYYKLEVWGASGCATSSTGYGGYSVGVVHFTAPTTLYVFVGGQGECRYGKDGSRTLLGGYNGGGDGTENQVRNCTCYMYGHETVCETSSTVFTSGGGGATHIATTNRGELKNYTSNKDEVLIVAGGGGGGQGNWQCDTSSSNTGGVGGGLTGGNGLGTGGNQTGGTSLIFGQGGTGSGGGWYGGGGTLAGGSGYIGNGLLVSYDGVTKSMYCYNCATSTTASTKTISTTNNSATATSGYAKLGDGYAKIELIKAD